MRQAVLLHRKLRAVLNPHLVLQKRLFGRICYEPTPLQCRPFIFSASIPLLPSCFRSCAERLVPVRRVGRSASGHWSKQSRRTTWPRVGSAYRSVVFFGGGGDVGDN